MNFWTKFLQCYQSSLIQKLTSIRTEPKLMLEMPLRVTQWYPPSPEPMIEYVFQECLGEQIKQLGEQTVVTHDIPGILILAANSKALQTLDATLESIYHAIETEVAGEFIKHNISPRYLGQKTNSIQDTTLDRKTPSRLIWIPFGLPDQDQSHGAGSFWLGLALF